MGPQKMPNENKDEASENLSRENLEKVEIHYIKCSHFRNIFVSGVYGGFSKPDPRIYMSIFSERMPIPQMTVNTIENGSIKSEVETHGKKGVIRDVEANLILDIKTAKMMCEWLQKLIKTAEAK